MLFFCSDTEMTESVKSLSEWMTQLADPMKHIPIINLAIPGKWSNEKYYQNDPFEF